MHIKNKNNLQKLFKDILEYESKLLMDEDYEKLAYLCESNVFYNGKNIEKEKIRELTKIFGKSLELFS